MWKTILNNINSLILVNRKTLFVFALGALAGILTADGVGSLLGFM